MAEIKLTYDEKRLHELLCEKGITSEENAKNVDGITQIATGAFGPTFGKGKVTSLLTTLLQKGKVKRKAREKTAAWFAVPEAKAEKTEEQIQSENPYTSEEYTAESENPYTAEKDTEVYSY